MNPSKFYIIFLALISVVFFSCKTDDQLTNVSNAIGYVEYQYDYTVLVSGNPVKKQAYKRVNLTDAFFKLYDVNTLPDSIISILELPDSVAAKFRQVELFFVSDDCVIDSVMNPLSQPLGTSVVHVTLVDTLALALDEQKNLVQPYDYFNYSFTSIKSNKAPQCLDIKVNMNLTYDTIAHANQSEFSFNGQKSKKFTLLKIKNDQYQIISNGMANNKFYNLYYVGPIRKESDIQIIQK